MNNLVLFTVRSGSTLLSDILSYSDGTINLGELHSTIRDYNLNKQEYKNTTLFKTLSQESLTSQFHNAKTRGSDHIGFTKAKSKRIQTILQSDIPWTVKENTEKQTMDFDFIEHCCKSDNINVYMTHRSNIVDQFISKINARYRSEIAKHNKTFIFTNNDSIQSYDSMQIKFTWLYMYTNVFIEQLMMWRIVYDRFKPYIKLVSYENEIKPMNFTKLGISSEVVDRYKQETQHLVPTPHNSRQVIVVDDHPKPIVGAWEQSLHYIKKHQYLVEI